MELWCWRHPPAVGASGFCIGRTDLAVDPRKAKRLAHRVRHVARRHGLPHVVWVSPLRRSHEVGCWLRRWGWQVRVDAHLVELDFGAWDGRPWTKISWAEVQAWQDDLLHHAPGGGESLLGLARRVQAFCASLPPGPCQLVGHGGWINALLHLPPGLQQLSAERWPPAPWHASLTRFARPSVSGSDPGSNFGQEAGPGAYQGADQDAGQDADQDFQQDVGQGADSDPAAWPVQHHTAHR